MVCLLPCSRTQKRTNLPLPGQYYDLLHLYSLTGEPSEKHYLLMNGDLVDRGSWSIEVTLTALSFKWLYPKYMFINRGNHEAKDMNRSYGFEGEAKTKHGEQSYKLFAHVFTTCEFRWRFVDLYESCLLDLC